MKNPPGPVKVVMEAVCLMLGAKPKRIADPSNPAKKLDDYWPPSQGLLGESNFMAQLQAGTAMSMALLALPTHVCCQLPVSAWACPTSALSHCFEQEYDKDNIPPTVVAAIRPYLERPEFAPETVKKASKAAYGLCCWVRAMEAYDRQVCPGLFGRRLA